MKPLKWIMGTAFASLALTAATHAATTVYNADDLLVGVSKVGSTTSYIYDLGQASAYRDASSVITVDISSANLTTAFGSDWATNPDVYWTVVGATSLSAVGSDAARTVYATNLVPDGSTSSTMWTGMGTSTASAASDITSVGNAFKSKTSGGTNYLLQSTTATNAFERYQLNGDLTSTGTSFHTFAGGTEGQSLTGITTTTLDLYRLSYGSASSGQSIGQFTLSSSGNLSFTPVPEPSAALLGGLGMLGLLRRRRLSA